MARATKGQGVLGEAFAPAYRVDGALKWSRRTPADDGEAPPAHLGHRERMRQRLLTDGPNGFHDYELLEYLLTLALPRIDTKPVARALLSEFGDLPAILAAGPSALKRVPGVGESAAAAIAFVAACMVRSLQRQAVAQPAFSSLSAVVDYLHASLAHSGTEEFRVLFLNNRNRIIADECCGDGTVNQAPVYPREIVKRALELQATALILAHNHPSGDPAPSQDDIRMTKAIRDAAALFQIAIHDHLIIGRTGHTSFRAQGLL